MLLCFLCLVIACSLTFTEIEKDWEWLQRNLSDTLNSFDSEGDVTDFVCCKIQSVIANNIPDNQGIDGMSCSMISSACFMFQYFSSITVCYLLCCSFPSLYFTGLSSVATLQYIPCKKIWLVNIAIIHFIKPTICTY
jgi:hypothetical protein